MQSLHCVKAERPVWSPYVPIGQSRQLLSEAEMTVVEYLPLPHGVQALSAICAVFGLYLPVAQAVHVVATSAASVSDQRPVPHAVHEA